MKIGFELLAVLASGLFTGGALFIHFVEHPARMELGPVLGVPSFAAMYKRAAKMQPLLAFLSFLGGTAAWFAGASAWWLMGGIIMGSLFPYTFILMLPLNKELTDPGLDKSSHRAVELMDRWGNLHKPCSCRPGCLCHLSIITQVRLKKVFSALPISKTYRLFD